MTHDERDRYVLYRMCECPECMGAGKFGDARCLRCRGEGREKQEVATAGSPEAVGVALVTLAREGEWEGCPLGILDTEGQPGEKWLVRPWLPSARNVSDAGRTLQTARKRKTEC